MVSDEGDCGDMALVATAGHEEASQGSVAGPRQDRLLQGEAAGGFRLSALSPSVVPRQLCPSVR